MFNAEFIMFKANRYRFVATWSVEYATGFTNPRKIIIFNGKFIIFNGKFIIVNGKIVIFNMKIT